MTASQLRVLLDGPAIARMELPGCFAMTETGHGSNAAMRVEAFGVPEPALADAQPVAAVTP
jgi:alkylation response protein AidB-like acyl-CoA dehydrogenase